VRNNGAENHSCNRAGRIYRRRFDLPEDQSKEEVSLGAAKFAAPFTYPEKQKGGKNYGSFL
jgi:hypothetical protein